MESDRCQPLDFSFEDTLRQIPKETPSRSGAQNTFVLRATFFSCPHRVVTTRTGFSDRSVDAENCADYGYVVVSNCRASQNYLQKFRMTSVSR